MCIDRNARYCKAKLPAARRGSALPNTAEPMPTPSWPFGPAINAMKATSPGRPIIAAKAISPNPRMTAAKAISPGPIPLAARKAISAGGPMADPEGISPSAAITAAEAFWAPPMLIAMWAAGSEASFPGTLMRADARDAMPPEFATRGAAFAHRRKGPPRFATERRRARCFRDTPSLGLAFSSRELSEPRGLSRGAIAHLYSRTRCAPPLPHTSRGLNFSKTKGQV